MLFSVEMALLTQKYLREECNQEISADEILKRPLWKQVWFWWKALEKYEGKPFPTDLTLEEVKKNIWRQVEVG